VKTTALIVDDNAVNLKLLKAVLEADGDYTIACAESAEEALEHLAKTSPCLMLVDVRLPKMNGLDLTRLVRNDPRHAGMVIVAVTASAMKGDDEIALTAGCDAYVTKPIDTRTLPQLLADLLARR
jgi:two-component system cell cycle response regulator